MLVVLVQAWSLWCTVSLQMSGELPSDLEATLHRLTASFPYTTTLITPRTTQHHIQHLPPPILLLSHIYTVLSSTNRTEVDRELDALVKSNELRKFELLNQLTAYVQINDYIAKLQQIVNIDVYQGILQQQQSIQAPTVQSEHTQPSHTHGAKREITAEHNSNTDNVELQHQRSHQLKRRRLDSPADDTIDLTDDTSHTSGNNTSTERDAEYDHALAIYYLITRLLPQCTTSNVTRSQLYSTLYTALPIPYKSSTFQHILSFLIHSSILLQSQIESQYTFTIPYSSQYIADLFNGRSEVCALLKKRQYRMISYRQFEQVKLKRTKLSVRYIVDSLTGDYTVTKHKTGIGDVLSLTQQR